MMQPWFDPQQYAWIPGTSFGCAAVILGALAFWLVPQGRAKAFIVRSWFALWIVAVVFVGAGGFAWVDGQPWGVWYGLALPGVVGVGVLGIDLLVILKRYHAVEVASQSAPQT